MASSSYKCAECGAEVIIDDNQVATRSCEGHEDKGIILNIGDVVLTGVGACG